MAISRGSRNTRFYRIEDLIGRDQIDEYVGRARVACYVLDIDGKCISTSDPGAEICRSGTTATEPAALERCRADWMRGAAVSPTAYLHSCADNTARHFSVLRVGDEIVGYVAGPQFRLRDEQSTVSSTSVEGADPPPTASEDEIAAYSAETASIARQLSRRGSSERGLRLLTEGVRVISDECKTEDAVHERLLETLYALFQGSSVELWIHKEESGELRRVDWGLTVGEQEPVFKAEEDLPPAFEGSTIKPAAQREQPGLIKVEVLAGGIAVAVIRLYSNSGGFSSNGRKTVEVLATCAGMAIERARLIADSSLRAQFAPPSSDSNWSDIVAELMLRTIETGHEASRARTELFQNLVKLAAETSGAIRGSVRAHLEGELAVINTWGEGWNSEKQRTTHRENKRSASWHAVLTRLPYLINDVDAKPQPEYYVPVFEDAKSNYALPIFLRGEVTAVLTLQSTKPNVFTARLRRTIRSMVKQCGDVLDRLTDIQDRWLSTLEADLERTSEDLPRKKSGPDPDSMITALCRTAVAHSRRILGAHGCSIFLLTKDLVKLVAVASTAPWFGEAPAEYVSEGLTGWVAKHGETLRVENIKNEEELKRIHPDLKWKPKDWGEIDHKTVHRPFGFLAAPLATRGRTIGVIRCSLKEGLGQKEGLGDVFDFADELLINNVAGIVASRIEDIQLRQESARRIDDLSSLVQLDNRLAATQDLRAVGKIILDYVKDITVCVAAHLRYREPDDDNTLRLAAAYSPHNEWIPATVLVGDPKSVTGTQVLKGKSLFESDVQENELWREILRTVMDDARASAQWCTSGACLLLIQSEKVVGTLLLEWTTRQDFSDEQKTLLEALAERCASAIKGALVYQEQLREIRDKGLEFFTNPVLSEPDDSSAARSTDKRILVLDDVLQRFLTESLELSEIDLALVRLLDESRKKWVLSATKTRDDSNVVDARLLAQDLDEDDEFLAPALESRRSFISWSWEQSFQEFKNRVVGSHVEFLDKIKWLRIFPLWGGDRCIGFLSLTSSSETEPAASRILFLETLAVFASSAIISAQRLDVERVNTPLAVLGAMLGGFLRHGGSDEIMEAQRKIDLLGPGRPMDNEAIRRYQGEARAAIQRIAESIRRLSMFSQSRASSEVDVNDMVRHFRAEALGGAALNKHNLLTELGEELPLVKINEDHIKQVLRLLLRNSIEAMPNGGDIVIGTTRKKEEAVIWVKDYGTGMDEPTLKHCKEYPFTTKSEGGEQRGLGLPVVELLVRHNGGRLDIQSAPGQGTTVSIYFPKEGSANAKSARSGR